MVCVSGCSCDIVCRQACRPLPTIATFRKKINRFLILQRNQTSWVRNSKQAQGVSMMSSSDSSITLTWLNLQGKIHFFSQNSNIFELQRHLRRLRGSKKKKNLSDMWKPKLLRSKSYAQASNQINRSWNEAKVARSPFSTPNWLQQHLHRLRGS